MNFKEFFKKYVILETSFDTLPEQTPYGFWVYPSGNFAIVKFQQHYNVGDRIIKRSPKLKKEWNEYNENLEDNANSNMYAFDIYSFLYTKGFSRCAFSYEKDVLFYKDPKKETDIYAPYRTVSLSNKALKTIKDLAMFYNAEAKSAN